jgi:tetratricopeptide (TPR) repeat protein
MPRLGVLVVCLLVPCVAAAKKAQEDPDTEIAKRHFVRGTDLYLTGNYPEAIREFEAAKLVKPLPAFDYNIARCHDRMEHLEEAIASYQVYLSAVGNSPEATEARDRIDVLQARIARRDAARQQPTAPPPVIVTTPQSLPPPTVAPVVVTAAPRHRLSLAAPIAVGVAAVAVLGAGLGLTLSAGAEFDRLNGSCAPNCPRASWDGLPGREQAGIALLAVAGAAAAVDVVLWVLHAQRPRERRLATTRGGLEVRF